MPRTVEAPAERLRAGRPRIRQPRCHPARRAISTGRNAAISIKRKFQLNEWALLRHAQNMAQRYPARRVRHHAGDNLDAGRAQLGESLACDTCIGIADARHHARYTAGDDGVRARPRLTLMRTGL